ncbi:aldehyde dehydrogenase [Nocardia sp. NPDC052278]|uniref:aldehyde dehydrogenase n=1 Tax=unclassified Nocardia TaxID=2637762 RepID=UPI0036B998B7
MTSLDTQSASRPRFSDRDTVFVDGEWVPATGDRTFQVIDPSTEEVVARVREASASDVARAVGAARAAFDGGPWAASSPGERADILDVFADALLARSEDLAQAGTAEIGMPITMSRLAHSDAAIGYLRYYAEMVRTFPFRDDRPRQDGKVTRVLHEPVGPVAAIVPFNGAFPVACMKLAPALAAGCTVVLKSSPETPLAVNILAEVAGELTAAGVLPAGVVNVVVADVEGSTALVADPRIDKITFTGSTAVARQIVATAGERIARVTLELGGKSAALVLDDAPLDETVTSLLLGGLINSGQACFGLTRVLVSERRRDELVDAMKAQLASTFVVGDSHDSNTTFGPLAGPRHRDRVESYVALAIEEGARVAAGGIRPAHLPRGFFFEPTILVDVENSMRIAQEEIFGPVVSVITYRDVDHAVAIANDSPYGLGGAVFSADAEQGFEVARRLRTGTVSLNGFVGAHVTTPFGGYKQSGLGREGGAEGLLPFLEVKSVHTQF